ncbi:MAG: hypothetical protein PHO32_09625, partial [Candidatus Cloacimonetes bacterium]|nr:hypothetical protein [Candidatus Cloacimonadota bacterium]
GTYTNLAPSGTKLTFTPTEEKEYIITVTVSDDLGNSKTRSVAITSLGSKLAIDDWNVAGEGFLDSKLNPGEHATIQMFVSNTGNTAIAGLSTITASHGATLDFNPATVNIGVGETLQVNLPITLTANFSEESVTIQYFISTQNQNQIPAILSADIEIPVDFYVTINPVTELITERIINISGRIANPLIQSAMLIMDGDVEQAYDINVTNGSFSQAIVLSGSLAQVQHTVRVIAISGGLTAENTMSFNSLVPVMALRATLTWDTNGTDVDFWITDPNDEKCYYSNPVTESGLTLDVDDTNGYGPENITTQNIIPGDYIVKVHYFSDHDSENAIGSNCVVVINKDENSTQSPVNYYGYLADSGDIWNVTTLTYDSVKGWRIKPTNSYGRVDSATLPAK